MICSVLTILQQVHMQMEQFWDKYISPLVLTCKNTSVHQISHTLCSKFAVRFSYLPPLYPIRIDLILHLLPSIRYGHIPTPRPTYLWQWAYSTRCASVMKGELRASPGVMRRSWSIVNILFRTSMNSRRSVFSPNNSDPSKSVGTLI